MAHLLGLLRSVSAAVLVAPVRAAALVAPVRAAPSSGPTPLRTAVTLSTGGVRSEPPRNRFAVLGALLAVIPGLLLGASISKNFASFLEENDLFVPSDDDDDG